MKAKLPASSAFLSHRSKAFFTWPSSDLFGMALPCHLGRVQMPGLLVLHDLAFILAFIPPHPVFQSLLPALYNPTAPNSMLYPLPTLCHLWPFAKALLCMEGSFHLDPTLTPLHFYKFYFFFVCFIHFLQEIFSELLNLVSLPSNVIA